jgi:predicted  nucleic acid-binding Zn-ribbon protein
MAVPVSPILRDCHRLRKHLRDLQNEIDRGPRVLTIRQKQLAAEEQAHKDAYEAIKKLKLKQKDDEGTLKSVEAQIGKLQQRSVEVTTMKEMQAVKSEIEQATARKEALEDAILASMSEIEERTADLPNVEKKWADAQADFKQYQVDAKERLERMIDDQKKSQADLAETEAKLPPDVKPIVDRQVKAHGPDAFAALTGGRFCQHCRSSITDQQGHELMGGKFMTCPHCFRVLYWPD